MPESAEVKLTAEHLHSTLAGKLITDLVFTGGKYTDTDPEGFELFDQLLPMTVQSVEAKGKFLYMRLTDRTNKPHFVMHSLMLSGRWQSTHDSLCNWFVEFETSRKRGRRDSKGVVWFRDPSNLGTISFTDDPEVLTHKLESLGPDILGVAFNRPLFRELLEQNVNRNITSILMDQSVISGCGNVIKAEALYYAGISPLRKTGSLTLDERDKLYEALYVIPRMAYNYGGTSVKDFTVNDEKGSYQDELKIYGLSHAKRTKTADGRVTYWDPTVQV